MNKTVIAILALVICISFKATDSNTILVRETTVDSLGACQGISIQDGRIFLYGDREIGMIREYKMQGDSLSYVNKEYQLTEGGKDVINHPTGIAYRKGMPTFIGNSVRMNPEGTVWKAVVYCVNWEGLQKTGTLDGNLLNTIDDDACIQGTRPEYVHYHKKWYIATADYGGHDNEVRLYDAEKLKNCKKTSDAGVVVKKFTCTPWVQNLHYVQDKDMLVLIQNQVEGRKWRLTYVSLTASLDSGKMVVIGQKDIDSRADELEGFAFTDKHQARAIAVTSSRKNNVNYLQLTW